MHASTALTADDGARQSDRAKLQTSAIFHLPRGCCDRNPGHVCRNRQANPRMLDTHQAVPTGALRPTESSALPQDPNGKAEAIEALLYECSTLTLCQEHYAKVRTVNHPVLLRIIGAQCERPDHRMTSYNRAFEITRRESIETMLRTRKRLWAEAFIRMSGGRLPKRIVFGNLEGAVCRGWGGREKEWTDCVQSGIRAFGIAEGWKTTAMRAEVWVETGTEGERRFVAAWRKEEVDAASIGAPLDRHCITDLQLRFETVRNIKL